LPALNGSNPGKGDELPLATYPDFSMAGPNWTGRWVVDEVLAGVGWRLL
jgi:hypothetical protein